MGSAQDLPNSWWAAPCDWAHLPPAQFKRLITGNYYYYFSHVFCASCWKTTFCCCVELEKRGAPHFIKHRNRISHHDEPNETESLWRLYSSPIWLKCDFRNGMFRMPFLALRLCLLCATRNVPDCLFSFQAIMSSADLNWLIVRGNNSYLLKKDNIAKPFSTVSVLSKLNCKN